MLKANQIIETEYDEKAVVSTKEDLINKIIGLELSEFEIGKSFSWWDIDGYDLGTAYCAEKMKWQDSLIVLIGGYGGETLCASLDEFDNEFNKVIIRYTVSEFFKLRNIYDDEFIAIEKNN